MNGTVIVGLDGSSAAAEALRWACDLARATGRTLRVVHTWHSDLTPLYAPVGDLDLDEETRRPGGRPGVDGLPPSSTTARSSWRLDVVQGSPGPALVRVAAEEDDCVLVVGTHEHHGLGRVLHGSISHYVLSHAPCPVVAVPPPEPELVAVYGEPSAQSVGMPDVPRF
jgi:nucleotide-binding universal stress UspA family protein